MRLVSGSVLFLGATLVCWIASPAAQAPTPGQAPGAAGPAATAPKNLKVLPKTWSNQQINALMRNIFTRLRSEHYGVPVVNIHSPYATSMTLGKWNPGTVMYDLFIDELARR